MTILVDPSRWPHRGAVWCHMVSDTSFDELHAFASLLGLARVAFQGDHYDLDEALRARAVHHGALEVSGRDVVRALDGANLRRGPAFQRRGLDGVRHLVAPTLTTDRLTLRQWTDDDRDPFAQLNADPQVAKWLAGPLSTEQSNALLDRSALLLALRGFGLWSVHERGDDAFVGAVGLNGVSPAFSFSPALELAWRLAPVFWGRGFASEAAAVAATYANEVLQVDRVAAFTSVGNAASVAVMNRLGMRADDTMSGSEFDHPHLPEHHPLRRHLLRWWYPSSLDQRKS